MLRVVQPFYDGTSHRFFNAGLEIADDPALAYAEARGLIKKIEEEKPKAEVKEKKETVKKTPAKKATSKKEVKK